MIISDEHKYIFIQLPRTGSTAIANELREQYEGRPFLYKHATYEEFLKLATPEQRRYFVFSCIRNPLDDVVSVYAKYAQDPRNRFKDPERRKKQSLTFLERMRDRKRMQFIERSNADFPAFFLKFYRLPYIRWSELSHAKFDFVIHFERLEKDFHEALLHIGIEPKRPLPMRNRTEGKGRDYLTYYTPETVGRAKRVFGPYMKKWGYTFPQEWGEVEVSWLSQLEYKLVRVLMDAYWKFVRPQLVKLRTMAHSRP